MADVKAAAVVLLPTLETNPRIGHILADQSYRGQLSNALSTAALLNLV